MAEAAKALGQAGSLPFRGHDYQLKPFTFDGICWFELQLEARAWESVERTRHLVPAEVYERRLEAMAKLIAAGRFAYGSDAAAEAAKSLWGQKKILYWMLAHEGNAALDVDERLIEDMLSDNLAAVAARVTEANADPNAAAPATDPGSR